MCCCSGIAHYPLGVTNPVWVEQEQLSRLPPAYSEEPPPGHTTFAHSPQHSRSSIPQCSDIIPPLLSRPGATSGSSGTTSRSGRRRRRARTSNSSSSPAADVCDTSCAQEEGRTPGPARWPRNGIRARRQISPALTTTPPRSTRQAADESQAQEVLQSMTRPRSSKRLASEPGQSTLSDQAPTVPNEDSSQSDMVTSTLTPVEVLRPCPANRRSRAKEGRSVLSPSAESSQSSKPKQPGDADLDNVHAGVSSIQLQPRGTPVSHISPAMLPGQTVEAPDMDEKAPSHDGERSTARGQDEGYPSHDSSVRRELFPTPCCGLDRDQPAPWQMMVVGKRSRSWQSSSSSSKPSHSRSRRRHKSHSVTGVNSPIDLPELDQRRSSIGTSVLLESKEQDIDPPNTLSSISKTHPVTSSGVRISLRDKAVSVTPLLRPVKRREPHRLPPLEASH